MMESELQKWKSPLNFLFSGDPCFRQKTFCFYLDLGLCFPPYLRTVSRTFCRPKLRASREDPIHTSMRLPLMAEPVSWTV